MELWLSQVVIKIVMDLYAGKKELIAMEQYICEDIIDLFDVFFHKNVRSLIDLMTSIKEIQKQLDFEINNCAISRKVNINIQATRGKLIFGIPKVLAKHLPSLDSCLFLYLLDEFENLSESQQKYVNTILRERENPCSFKIGSRLYGIKTYDTYTPGEQNKVDSEFEILRLDDILRKSKNYNDYAKRLIASRFAQCRYPFKKGSIESVFCINLDTQFQGYSKTKYFEEETSFIISTYKDRERPYFKTLRKKLIFGVKQNIAIGVKRNNDIDIIINNLQYPSLPLIEKVNIFLFYKAWSSNKNSLVEESRNISNDCDKYLKDQNDSKKYKSNVDHFKADLLSQLLRECNRDQKYYGLSTFIEMSWGVPRNLLVLLKNIYAWAIFLGETPFEGRPISIKAQNSGVIEASKWFFSDAKISGKEGRSVRDSINRLGNFFRDIRFSDKPSECSLVSFSADLSSVSSTAKKIIQLAQDYSLLIEVGKDTDKNTGEIYSKLQLNRMLTPIWDLSIYRRGTINLSTDEINSIFDQEYDEKQKNMRVKRMNAPYFGRFKKSVEELSEYQINFPGFEDV